MNLETERSELDLLPEYCQFHDEGCEFASACLNCPLPRCIYEEPGGRQRWLKRQRNRDIVRLFYKESKGVKELSLMFGVSCRTVQRTLKNYLATLKQALSSQPHVDAPVAENQGLEKE